MLSLLHALIPCVTALVYLLFGTVIPTSFNILANGNVFTLLILETAEEVPEVQSREEPVLPQRYKRILQRILHMDSREIAELFLKLYMHTQRVLGSEGVAVVDLVNYTSQIFLVTNDNKMTLANEVRAAETIPKAFIVMLKKKYITFYKFSVLESIIKNLCTDTERTLNRELDEYKDKFQMYIKRRVCETALYYDAKFFPGEEISPKEKCNLVLITDSSWDRNTSLEAVLELEAKVASIFGINDIVLTLSAIEDNCLRLYYSTPPLVEDVVVSMTYVQVEMLEKCGIEGIIISDLFQLTLKECKSGKSLTIG